MKVLVTGTDGYIGVMMGPVLQAAGHEVTGLDTGYYKDGWLYDGAKPLANTIKKDIRHITEKDLEGFDAVAHLAELSNDPLGQLNPDITYKINHIGSVEMAKKAKAAGVKRFVYMSSCSVYGLGSDEYRTEESETAPQTAYAKCKVMVERDVSQLAGPGFSPTFMRNATAYGPSPRMRFDIVVNNLSALAWTTREIKMTSDGTPWRPLVHLLDICQAVERVLAAPKDVIHNQIFNVGNTEDNYRVKEIAEIVAETFPGCKLSFGAKDPDNRSYRVSFDKIKNTLPGFKTKYRAGDGSRQLKEIFETIAFNDDTFKFRAFTRLKQLEHLIGTGKLDNDFFWK